MRPRDSKIRDLHAVAGAVIGSAAAVTPVTSGVCVEQWQLPGGTIACNRHIDGCPPSALTAEQRDSTDAVRGREQGVHREDERTHSVVGVNSRRIIVREDADGLYVGGVLLDDPIVVMRLADLLGAQGRRLALIPREDTPVTSDPLGLTPEQRMWSNVFASVRRRSIWWPPELDDRVIDGEWSELRQSVQELETAVATREDAP